MLYTFVAKTDELAGSYHVNGTALVHTFTCKATGVCINYLSHLRTVRVRGLWCIPSLNFNGAGFHKQNRTLCIRHGHNLDVL